jgi:ComF family protein
MRFTRRIVQTTRPVVDTLFPATCWADASATEAASGLSDSARTAIGHLAAQRYCHACGLTTGPHAKNSSRFHCGRCEQRDAGVVRVARVGTFSEPLVTLVHRLKFERAWEVARVLAPFLYQAMLAVSEESSLPVEVMVPVPLHWMRRAKRGFNQAEELAREVAALSGWPLHKGLRRVRRTVSQTRLDSRTRRAENLKDAFVCNPTSAFAGKHVWLIDDVSTTGATLHAAATALRKLAPGSRPASINAAVICITDHGSPPPLTEILGDFSLAPPLS